MPAFAGHDDWDPGGDMRQNSKLLAGSIAIFWFCLAPASAAGGWKYQVIPNDGHVLTYSENDKVTFYLGCGRGFVLLAKYPGMPK
jgi:hypothetical protein